MSKASQLSALLVTLLLTISGCAQVKEQTSSDSEPQESNVTQNPEAEKMSTPIPSDSIFAKVKVDMSDDAVLDILGKPGTKTDYQTGKSWIPFSGRWLNDKRRQTWFYENLGVIVMTQNTYSKQFKVLRVEYNANQSLP